MGGAMRLVRDVYHLSRLLFSPDKGGTIHADSLARSEFSCTQGLLVSMLDNPAHREAAASALKTKRTADIDRRLFQAAQSGDLDSAYAAVDVLVAAPGAESRTYISRLFSEYSQRFHTSASCSEVSAGTERTVGHLLGRLAQGLTGSTSREEFMHLLDVSASRDCNKDDSAPLRLALLLPRAPDAEAYMRERVQHVFSLPKDVSPELLTAIGDRLVHHESQYKLLASRNQAVPNENDVAALLLTKAPWQETKMILQLADSYPQLPLSVAIERVTLSRVKKEGFSEVYPAEANAEPIQASQSSSWRPTLVSAAAAVRSLTGAVKPGKAAPLERAFSRLLSGDALDTADTWAVISSGAWPRLSPEREAGLGAIGMSLELPVPGFPTLGKLRLQEAWHKKLLIASPSQKPGTIRVQDTMGLTRVTIESLSLQPQESICFIDGEHRNSVDLASFENIPDELRVRSIVDFDTSSTSDYVAFRSEDGRCAEFANVIPRTDGKFEAHFHYGGQLIFTAEDLIDGKYTIRRFTPREPIAAQKPPATDGEGDYVLQEKILTYGRTFVEPKGTRKTELHPTVGSAPDGTMGFSNRQRAIEATEAIVVAWRTVVDARLEAFERMKRAHVRDMLQQSRDRGSEHDRFHHHSHER